MGPWREYYRRIGGHTLKVVTGPESKRKTLTVGELTEGNRNRK
jgi:hypothetical protein